MMLGTQAGNGRGVELAGFLAVLRVDAQLAIRRGRNGHIRRHVQRHGENESKVVIGVFADDVDASGRAKHADALGGAVETAETVYHDAMPSVARIFEPMNP